MRRPPIATRFACLTCALVLACSIMGCTRGGTVAGGRDKWSSTATEVAQPAEWPDVGYVERLAPSRELVRAYLRAATCDDRDTMTGIYLPETRRSAETVIVRDVELSARGGPYSPGPTNTTSVFLYKGGLFPSGADLGVSAEDEARLRDLKRGHGDATIVVTQFPSGGRRVFFVVRDGEALHLVP